MAKSAKQKVVPSYSHNFLATDRRLLGQSFVMPLPSTTELVARRSEFQRSLLNWYGANARVLPWRVAPSPYKTVVSEFMLQQTQVKTVLPYFARWLETLPDFASLAAASEAQVLKLWEGLGYYSRARNLHKLGKAVAALSQLPTTPAEWQELPGVGPYTAAAITSISFSAPSACVDGNVVRILARLTAESTLYRDSASAAKVLTPLADALLTRDAPGSHNQAMMELGATVCFRQKPLCVTCPVLAFCAAGRSRDPEAYPRLAPKQIEQRVVTRVWCERGDSLLLHRAGAAAKRLAHQYELPLPEHVGATNADFAALTPVAIKRRAITRFQITESIYSAGSPKGKLGEGLAWIPFGDLETITLSGPHKRWIGEILAKR
jgi:A/G-specific adenine glycosylase